MHGAAHDHSARSLQSRYFAYHGCNVLAFDLPGHGRSEGPPLASIGAMADWIVAALDAAGIEQAALVGHSMGSLAALECAARHPERVRALALDRHGLADVRRRGAAEAPRATTTTTRST